MATRDDTGGLPGPLYLRPIALLIILFLSSPPSLRPSSALLSTLHSSSPSCPVLPLYPALLSHLLSPPSRPFSPVFSSPLSVPLLSCSLSSCLALSYSLSTTLLYHHLSCPASFPPLSYPISARPSPFSLSPSLLLSPRLSHLSLLSPSRSCPAPPPTCLSSHHLPCTGRRIGDWRAICICDGAQSRAPWLPTREGGGGGGVPGRGRFNLELDPIGAGWWPCPGAIRPGGAAAEHRSWPFASRLASPPSWINWTDGVTAHGLRNGLTASEID